MKNKNIFIQYILSSSLNIKFLFITLFILFGLSIAFITYFVNLYYANQNIKNELLVSAKNTAMVKEKILLEKKEIFKNTLFAIKESDSFKNYIKNKTNQYYIKDILQTTMNSNHELMQIRYIDKYGQENIRINRTELGKNIYFTSNKKLTKQSR